MFNLKIMSAACGSCEFGDHKDKIYFVMIKFTHQAYYILILFKAMNYVPVQDH